MTSQLKAKKKDFVLKDLKLNKKTRKVSREANLAETDAKAMNFAEILMGTKKIKLS